ncbi:hypothetical protein PtA15_2A254 [Puccinia triticina]|uniref:C2H2-type domain-containing protein n=1 Tax=Puccinia triticina TaxID=208348 RepID=A0ABY7CCR6_9BASI|nr:uncharacterized protein PtA15_2A254 [Puccinia triticina]WAQ81941.1 hypothetical protein PtA15_2A254 [Puccinia triticina]
MDGHRQDNNAADGAAPQPTSGMLPEYNSIFDIIEGNPFGQSHMDLADPAEVARQRQNRFLFNAPMGAHVPAGPLDSNGAPMASGSSADPLQQLLDAAGSHAHTGGLDVDYMDLQFFGFGTSPAAFNHHGPQDAADVPSWSDSLLMGITHSEPQPQQQPGTEAWLDPILAELAPAPQVAAAPQGPSAAYAPAQPFFTGAQPAPGQPFPEASQAAPPQPFHTGTDGNQPLRFEDLMDYPGSPQRSPSNAGTGPAMMIDGPAAGPALPFVPPPIDPDETVAYANRSSPRLNRGELGLESMFREMEEQAERGAALRDNNRPSDSAPAAPALESSPSEDTSESMRSLFGGSNDNNSSKPPSPHGGESAGPAGPGSPAPPRNPSPAAAPAQAPATQNSPQRHTPDPQRSEDDEQSSPEGLFGGDEDDESESPPAATTSVQAGSGQTGGDPPRPALPPLALPPRGRPGVVPAGAAPTIQLALPPNGRPGVSPRRAAPTIQLALPPNGRPGVSPRRAGPAIQSSKSPQPPAASQPAARKQPRNAQASSTTGSTSQPPAQSSSANPATSNTGGAKKVTKGERVKCDECGADLAKSSLRKHKIAKHAPPPTQPPCPFCDGPKTSLDIARHIRKCHEDIYERMQRTGEKAEDIAREYAANQANQNTSNPSAGPSRATAGPSRAPAGQGIATAGPSRVPAGQGNATAGPSRAPAGQGNAPAGPSRAPAGQGNASTDIPIIPDGDIPVIPEGDIPVPDFSALPTRSGRSNPGPVASTSTLPPAKRQRRAATAKASGRAATDKKGKGKARAVDPSSDEDEGTGRKKKPKKRAPAGAEGTGRKKKPKKRAPAGTGRVPKPTAQCPICKNFRSTRLGTQVTSIAT